MNVRGMVDATKALECSVRNYGMDAEGWIGRIFSLWRSFWWLNLCILGKVILFGPLSYSFYLNTVSTVRSEIIPV